jgi:hypothetical protein
MVLVRQGYETFAILFGETIVYFERTSSLRKNALPSLSHLVYSKTKVVKSHKGANPYSRFVVCVLCYGKVSLLLTSPNNDIRTLLHMS